MCPLKKGEQQYWINITIQLCTLIFYSILFSNCSFSNPSWFLNTQSEYLFFLLCQTQSSDTLKPSSFGANRIINKYSSKFRQVTHFSCDSKIQLTVLKHVTCCHWKNLGMRLIQHLLGVAPCWIILWWGRKTPDCPACTEKFITCLFYKNAVYW